MINDICEKLYGKKFNFKTAFNHSSYANEKHIESNEKLEFLGDSIINFYVTSWLYLKNKTEGELSKLRAKMVSTSAFVKICDSLNLTKNLKIIGGISAKIKANLLEAVIAEIYLQLKNKNDIDKIINYLIIKNFNSNEFTDYKTVLQELVQKNNVKIFYKVKKSKNGFTADVYKNNVFLATGTGVSKKLAEKDAAKIGINILKKEGKKQ